VKNNRGITLIILIFTIVIMIILVSIGIYVGMETVEHSRVVKFVSYMQIIQRKVDDLASDSSYEELGVPASGQSNAQEILNLASTNGEIQNTVVDDYKYFDKTTLSSQLGIDNIEDEIIINFTTREVVSLNGIDYKSKMYYTQYLLPTGQQIIIKSLDEDRTLSFELTKNIEGLKANIEITNISITNGTLSYKEENGQWEIINNYTKNGNNDEIAISKSGTYIFKLTDNNDSNNKTEKNIRVLLGNQPKLPEGWTYNKENYDYSTLINEETGLIDIGQIRNSSANAQDGEGATYCWVPRLAYEKSNPTNIKLLKGTSLIATDNTVINKNDWEIPEEFSNEEGEGFLDMTGRWLTITEIHDLLN